MSKKHSAPALSGSCLLRSDDQNMTSRANESINERLAGLLALTRSISYVKGDFFFLRPQEE